ncbi:MAG: hypothetical protein ACTSRC_09600 [Candidatus Helarchaeota archaeon]
MSVTFAAPVAAQCSKPGFALDQGDMEGWVLFNESCVESGMETYTFSIWTQVWIDDEAWDNATKVVGIVALDFGIDLNTEVMGDTSLWDLMMESFAGYFDYEIVTGTGLDQCIIWNETGVWFALGYKGSVLVMAFGWNSQMCPGDIFLGMAKSKVDETAVTAEDLKEIMTAQGSEFGGGIPSFTLVPILASIALILGMIYFIRKNQFNLLKTT